MSIGHEDKLKPYMEPLPEYKESGPTNCINGVHMSLKGEIQNLLMVLGVPQSDSHLFALELQES